MKQRQNKIIPVFEYILLSVAFACLIVFFVLESVLPNDQANVSGRTSMRAGFLCLRMDSHRR